MPLDKLRQVLYIKYITNARKSQGVLENFVDKISIQWVEISQNCTMRRDQGGVTMNLYLRKDGRYESRVPNGKKTDGKRAFLYVLARTKEQCIERVQAIHRQHRPQRYCTLTVAELFSEWHRSTLHRVKESTAANYTMKADKHILPAFGDMPVSTLTADSIYDFIADKQKAGFSPRYIADIVILMKTIFKYAVRTYQVFNPMDGIVLPKKKSPEIQLL